MADIINERTTSYIEVELLDKGGVLAYPASIVYSTYCKTNGTPIKTNVAVPAASVVNITLDSTDSAIINSANATEDKILTVKATYNTNDELNSEYNWTVKNLQGV
jgi:hypothetical protein